MTVNTTKITSGPYAGNDVADTFSYTFRITDKTQLDVYETTDLGVETLLIVDTDYTVTGVGVDAGGTITRVAGALPTDYTIYIRSNYQKTQLTAFQSQGAFFPDLHEDAMDQLTFLIQQICDGLDRTPRLSDSYTGGLPLSLEDPSPGSLIRWKGDLLGMENFDLVSSSLVSSGQLVIFPNIATMKADTSGVLVPGINVLTQGGVNTGDGGGRLYLVAPNQSVDDNGDHTLDNGNVALAQSHISVKTGTGTSESSFAIVIGDATYSGSIIGEGCVLIGGYQQSNKNRLPGTTELRSIIAGYDCEITERGVSDDGGLACVIVGSHHSEIQGDATHTFIAGGSYLLVTDGDYNGLVGGTLNELRNNNARPTHSGIVFGRGNIIDNANAFIAGSLNSTALGEFASIISGQDSVAEGNFDSVTGSRNESRKGTLGNGQKNTICGGRFNIIDSITSPQGNSIGGGESNEIYGISCSIGGGITCVIGTPSINSTYAVVAGGLSNLVTAVTAGSVGGGRDNNAAADYSTIPGGRNNKTEAIYSTALGYEAEARLSGFEALANGAISARGDNQALRGVKSVSTTNATPTPTGSLVMEDNSTWRFECVVTAHETGGSDAASFKITGLAQRVVGVGSVVFVGVPTVVNEFSTAGAAAWTATVITNTGAGAIRAEVTGAVATNINWCTNWSITECVGA